MDNIILKKNNLLKCDLAIKILSVISLVCTVLSSISYFFYYGYEYTNGEEGYRLIFQFPYIVHLILLLLTIAPVILFSIYILKFYNELEDTILVPVIFGLFSLKIFVKYYFMYGYGFGFDFGGHDLNSLIFDILIFITCLLAFISALQGFSKKGLIIIIAMSICLLYEVLSLIRFLSFMQYYIADSLYLYLFTSPMGIIGSSALYVALILFALNNKIPSVPLLSSENEKEGAEQMDPEQALKLLKEKLDLGIITEEEYQAQRADIINKL